MTLAVHCGSLPMFLPMSPVFSGQLFMYLLCFVGAGGGSRTPDPLITNAKQPTLYVPLRLVISNLYLHLKASKDALSRNSANVSANAFPALKGGL